jgi:membrane-associated phospholipid phosphatase
MGSACDGRALPLQVTWPNNPDFWQVISVLYGYVPWLLSLGIAILFLIYRGTRELTVGLLVGLIAGINEVIKILVDQPRPQESCLSSRGMPSSHSAVAVGLFLFLVLDAAYRLKPLVNISDKSSCGHSFNRMLKGMMILPFGYLSKGLFASYLAIWSVLLLPVPISRVVLHDHSPTQALAGSFVGMIAVAIWFPLSLWMRSALRDHVGEKYLVIFCHNYDVPEGWKQSDDKEESVPIVPESPETAV